MAFFNMSRSEFAEVFGGIGAAEYSQATVTLNDEEVKESIEHMAYRYMIDIIQTF
jgi:hypothetical protein